MAWYDRYLSYVAEVEAEIQTVHSDAKITVTARDINPALTPETEGTAEALARRLTGDNGNHVVSYGTEAGQFQREGYSVVVCGPGSIDQAHQPNEYVTVAQFNAGVAFMERLVQRLETEG